MVRKLMTDARMLRIPSQPAVREDIALVQDLVDTLEHYQDRCVGMAANMIGENKRIIAICPDETRVFLNPVITEKSDPYIAEEGCLCLPGTRRTTRYRRITLQYQSMAFFWQTEVFEGFAAQIIQHEMDHCDGILI